MTELSPDGRALFASARQGLAPSAEDSARNEQRLATLLGTAAFSASGTVSAGVLVSARPGLRTWLGLSGHGMAKLYVLGVAVAVIGAGALMLRSSLKAKPAFALTSQTGVASAVSIPAQPAPLVPLGASTPAASASPSLSDGDADALPQPVAKPAHAARTLATPKPDLAEESRLLRSADAALRAGDLPHALALLDEHAAKFPHGVLAEERSLERISTLCKMGRISDAQLEFQRFGWASSDSPLASTARSTCVK